MRKLLAALLLSVAPLLAQTRPGGGGSGGGGGGSVPTYIVSTPQSLTAALAICSTCTLQISSTITASANASIPTTTTLNLLQGGTLSVNTGVTVNFQGGQVQAGPYQIFTGPGVVTNLPVVEPEWFGAISSATTLPLAAAALQSGGVLQFGVGRYNASSWSDATPLTLSNITLAGAAMPYPNSVTTPTSLVGGTVLYPGFTGSGSFLNIHDLGTDTGSATTGTPGDSFNLVSYSNATVAATPGVIGAVPSASGGTLAAGNHYYRVTSTTASGETGGSPEVVANTTGSTGSVALSWTAISGATGYKVYRGASSGGENTFYTTATNSFTDINGASTAGNIPPFNTTGATGKNINLRNITCLGNSTSVAFHCGKVEGYNNVMATNLWSYRNEDGWVWKTTNSVITNVHGQGHVLACVYVKSEAYAQVVNTAVENISCQPEVVGDTADGIIVQAGSETAIDVAVNNLVASGVQAAVNITGGSTVNIPVQQLVMTNVTASGVTQDALVVSGYINGAALSGWGITNSAGWFNETTAADPNIKNLVLSNWIADTQSQAGCMNIPGEGAIYPPYNVTQSGCNSVVMPSPSTPWLVASGTTQTAVLTSNTVYPGTGVTFPTTVKIYGIQLIETNTGACTTQPVLYVYDTTANARANGTQVIFVNGTLTYNNSGASVTVPAGDTVALEAQANATCTTTPTFVATVYYQPQ